MNKKIRAGEAFAKANPEYREKWRQKIKDAIQATRFWIDDLQIYRQEWEKTYGEPLPETIEEIEQWITRADIPGKCLPADKIASGNYTLADITPFIEGYLQRLRDIQGKVQAITPPEQYTLGKLLHNLRQCETINNTIQSNSQWLENKSQGGGLDQSDRIVKGTLDYTYELMTKAHAIEENSKGNPGVLRIETLCKAHGGMTSGVLEKLCADAALRTGKTLNEFLVLDTEIGAELLLAAATPPEGAGGNGGGAGGEAPKKTFSKKSTTKGSARAKITAGLTKHHKYADGSALNQEPIKVNVFADTLGVSPSTVSKFLKDEYKGYEKYKAACRDSGTLVATLKLLNGEYSPALLLSNIPAAD